MSSRASTTLPSTTNSSSRSNASTSSSSSAATSAVAAPPTNATTRVTAAGGPSSSSSSSSPSASSSASGSTAGASGRLREDDIIQALPEGALFEDPEFPCDGRSLYMDPNRPIYGGIPAKTVVWRRPSEWAKKPVLFKDSVSAGDVIQGTLGDCWFLGALSVVAMRARLLERLFKSYKYAERGLYTLQFFKNGAWVEVIIDDRIPCDPTGEILNATCKDPNEIWVMLVEKAYAKLHNSYESIVGGVSDYALRDLTGGVTHTFDLLTPEMQESIRTQQLWTQLVEWERKSYLISCAAMGDHAAEEDIGEGILGNHAYGVLTVKEVRGNKLICLRNPWGMTEWQGAWSDNSKEWTAQIRQELNHISADDGTFWMKFEDFARYFNQICVAFLVPPEFNGMAIEGAWTEATAGGCSNFKTWATNPQYTLTLAKDSEVHIVLEQRDARMVKGAKFNVYDGHIGFSVVSDSRKLGSVPKLIAKDMVASSGQYRSTRTVQYSGKLAAGTYLIIPTTYHQGVLVPFTIYVISEKACELESARPLPESSMPDVDPINDPTVSKPVVEATPPVVVPEVNAVSTTDKLAAMVTCLLERIEALEAEVAQLKQPKLNTRPWLSS